MATPIRQLRGTASELATRVYDQGVITVDETNNDIRVHDGVTPGGIAVRPPTFDFSSRTAAIAARIAVPVQHVRTGGYSATGDGGGALYKRVASQPTHSAKFQSADGAWWELAETVVNLLMVGCKCDGTTNDSPMIAGAFQFAKTLYVPSGRKVRFGANIDIPANCSLEGFGNGWAVDPNDFQWIGKAGDAIVLESSATIRLASGAGIRNLLIRPPGVTTNRVTRAQADAWAGQAITFLGSHTDQTVENMTILGFNKAIGADSTTATTQRIRLRNILIDCTNGIDLYNSYDVSYVEWIHCWPVCSTGQTTVVDANLCRAGTAFRFNGTFDALTVNQCFAYGYQRGYHINGPDGVSLTDCAYDYRFGQSGQSHIALYITGNTSTCVATNFKVLTAHYAVVVDRVGPSDPEVSGQPDLPNLTLRDFSFGTIENTAIEIISGNVHVKGGLIHGAEFNGRIPVGIRVGSGSRDVALEGIQFAGVTTAIARDPGHAGRFMDYGRHTFTRVGTRFSGTGFKKSIPAADPLALDGENLVIEVTGNTPFGSASNIAPYAGKLLTLVFTGTPQVSTGASFILGSDFVATPNDTLTLACDGTRFYKVSSSAN